MLRLIAACLVMLFAVMPHLTAMTLPMGHDAATVFFARTGDDAPCHRQAAEPAEADHGASEARPGSPCCAWGCGVLGAVPPVPAAAPVRGSRRLNAVALPVAPGIGVEPGERPPRFAPA